MHSFFAKSIVVISYIVFMATSHAILYETVQMQNKMKTQQLPPEEVQRFVKERKAFRLVVHVVGAVLFCFTPAAALLLNIVYMV